jgi:hypothetical protein
MKRLLLLLIVFAATATAAQSFEGVITWSVSYTATDTAHKAGGINPVFPKGFTMQFGKNSYLLSTEGGILPVETLWLGDKQQYYQINRANKTYTLLAPDSSAGKLPEQYRPVVIKTSETATLLGYPCTKYIIRFKSDSSFTQTYWTTTAVNIPALKTLPGESGQAMYYEGMQGLPLKMELTSPQMRLVTEVTAIKKMALPDSLFILPPGYKEEKPFR